MLTNRTKTVFLINKPLQFLIAQSIISQLELDENCTLLIVDGFSESFSFSNRVRNCNLGWSEIKWFPSKKDAFNYINEKKFTKIFIDSDVGFKNLLSIIKIKTKKIDSKVFVYEEGIGSYRSDLYQGVRKFILNAIGAGTHFGGCIFTAGIYLNNPTLFLKKFPNQYRKCKKIERNVNKTICTNISKFNYLFDIKSLLSSLHKKPKSKNCVVYFSSWQVDLKIIERILSHNEDRYIKLHPHLKDKSFDFVGDVCFDFLPSNIPAEIIILSLKSIYKNITIYHHNSSLVLYIPESKSLKYISV